MAFENLDPDEDDTILTSPQLRKEAILDEIEDMVDCFLVLDTHGENPDLTGDVIVKSIKDGDISITEIVRHFELILDNRISECTTGDVLPVEPASEQPI